MILWLTVCLLLGIYYRVDKAEKFITYINKSLTYMSESYDNEVVFKLVYEYLKVSIYKIIFSFKPLKIESFYSEEFVRLFNELNSNR